ncbi:MAG: bifunctional phosphopantothenoylcysteine decarboxylase/phosphopantothenate--cysteine ligase CoaBC [Peptococcaceae bacterium]|jgi:phosphopantothenoylcysteine decarboxylase/phosphopantothenate--cysteine ligase|nr:bifunctional phosphopantothenoylcysteine decarboxylase/phosphopantothenate--cysteine ligase CoaBC [Peptococcaceae bacterium]
MLTGKTVLVGVTGGIAAYKAAELVSLLVREGTVVRVVMTAAATRFVAPLTFASLSGNPVACDLFAPAAGVHAHIDLAAAADLVVVAPATADFLAKAAAGLADDLLTTLLLACTRPVLLCPAMNTNMYRHPAVRENLARLARLGYHLMEPDAGRLACGTVGPGRLPEPARIVEHLAALCPRRDLAGYTVLVTAGATREPIDPVRFISNRSSGKMGFALARAALERGARVILVSGAAEVEPPPGVELVTVDTAEAMRSAVLSFAPECDLIVKAAAVADYRPARVADQKIKKDRERTLELVRNPDILQELGASKGNRVLVGFAAETENLLESARAKLTKKNLDLLVANDVSRADSGFGSDTNLVWLVFPEGPPQELPLMDKRLVAERILDEAAGILAGRRPTGSGLTGATDGHNH